MCLREQPTVGCFPKLCFFQFGVAQVRVGLRKQFINNFVFPLGPVPLVLIIIIIKKMSNLLSIHDMFKKQKFLNVNLINAC